MRQHQTMGIMTYGISILLTLAVLLSTNASLLEDIIRNGTRLEWIYHHNGVKYYMTDDIMMADVIDSSRTRFNVTYEIVDDGPSTTEALEPTEVTGTPDGSTAGRMMITSPSEMLHTIFRTIDRSMYVTIEESTDMLTTGGIRTVFTLIPVEGGDNQFNLFQDGETFVAMETTAPFRFARHRRFPAQPPAIFSLEPYQFYLNSSYGGQRNRIRATLEEIEQLLTEPERLVAFRDLVTQMKAFNHILGGAEAFLVGDSIRRSISSYVDTLPFIMLPEQVQLITQSASDDFLLKLSVLDPLGNIISVNDHLAWSQPWPIYPFTFSENRIKSGSGRHWVMDGLNRLQWTTSPSSGYFNRFFSTNTTDSFIISYAYSGFLQSFGGSGTSIGFRLYSPSRGEAAFIVSRYQVDVAEMYGGQDKSLGPEVAHIIRKYSPIPELGQKFEQLMDAVAENGDMTGKEVFSIGEIMTQSSLPSDHPAFSMIPEMVRVILMMNTSWIFQDPNGITYQMKYSSASDTHIFMEPYLFHISPPPLANQTFAPAKYCIVYGFGRDTQRLRIYIDPITKRLSHEVLGENCLVYDVELEIRQGGNVNLWWNNTRVGTADTLPDFYFEADNQLQSSKFSMTEYSI